MQHVLKFSFEGRAMNIKIHLFFFAFLVALAKLDVWVHVKL